MLSPGGGGGASTAVGEGVTSRKDVGKVTFTAVGEGATALGGGPHLQYSGWRGCYN